MRLDVLDGNTFGRGGWWEYRLEEPGGGTTTRVDLTVRRVPMTTRGRVLDVVLSLGPGKLFFTRDLRRSVRQLEQRVAG